MKKLAKTMLVAVMALSVTGCKKTDETGTTGSGGNKKEETIELTATVESLFENLKKKTEGVNDQTYRLYMDMNTSLSDGTTTKSSTFGETTTDGHNTYATSETTSASSGETSQENAEMYFVDDSGTYTMYENTDGGWVKYFQNTPTDFSIDFQKLMNIDMENSTLEAEDGLYVIKATIEFADAAEALPDGVEETVMDMVSSEYLTYAGRIPAVFQFDTASEELVSVRFDFATGINNALAHMASDRGVESAPITVDTMRVTLADFNFSTVSIVLPEDVKNATETSAPSPLQKESDPVPVETTDENTEQPEEAPQESPQPN